jgi:hypothetical protein
VGLRANTELIPPARVGAHEERPERHFHLIDVRPRGTVIRPSPDDAHVGPDRCPDRRIGRAEERDGGTTHDGRQVSRPRIVAHGRPREGQERRDFGAEFWSA